MFLANSSPPSWVQRLFRIDIQDATWIIELDRTDVNNVLDHLETTCVPGETTEIACELGDFVLQQMIAFRHAYDVMALQELSKECWGEES